MALEALTAGVTSMNQSNKATTDAHGTQLKADEESLHKGAEVKAQPPPQDDSGRRTSQAAGEAAMGNRPPGS